MVCEKCGNELNNGDKQCKKCGLKIEKEKTAKRVLTHIKNDKEKDSFFKKGSTRSPKIKLAACIFICVFLFGVVIAAKFFNGNNGNNGEIAKSSKSISESEDNTASGKLEVTSMCSYNSSIESGKIKIVYTISNTGNNAAEKIELKDTDIAGSKVIETIDSLSAGEKKVVEYTETMTEDCSSKPVVTCLMNGASKQFEGKAIKIAFEGTKEKTDQDSEKSAESVPVSEGIDVLVRSDEWKIYNKGEVTIADVTVTLEITNLMPKSFENVNIIDKSTGHTLQTIQTLYSDYSKTYEANFTLEKDTSIIYEITATYEDGTNITVQSNTLDIKIE